MKLINYTRAETAQGNLHPDVSSRALFQDDRFLLPVLPDDALLYSIIDLLPPEKVSQSRAHGQVDSMQSKSECEMEREIKDLKVCFEEYRQATQKLLNRRLELNQDEAGEDLAISKSGNEASDKGYFDSYAYSGPYLTFAVQVSLYSCRYRYT